MAAKPVCQPVYAGDVARAILAALEKEEAKGQTFELGGPGVYSFRELLDFTCKIVGRHPVFINIPFGIAKIKGMFLQLLPRPPLTRDCMVLLLGYDNIVSAGGKTHKHLGIIPHSVENIVPLYLARVAQNPSQAVV